jgi:F0F1-type ATP synthase assembly protein I
MIKIIIISVICTLIGFIAGFVSVIIKTKEMYDKRTNKNYY